MPVTVTRRPVPIPFAVVAAAEVIWLAGLAWLAWRP
jgi:hypothetical protein